MVEKESLVSMNSIGINQAIDDAEELVEVFRSQNVTLAYLFGSQAEGSARISSDIDIAVLLDYDLPSDHYEYIRIALIELISRFFKRDDVDIVILNRATPTLAMEVIKNGKIVYENPEVLPSVDFTARTITRYADAAHLRTLKRLYLEEWIDRNRRAASLLSESK